jgi:hypothetical protein
MGASFKGGSELEGVGPGRALAPVFDMAEVDQENAAASRLEDLEELFPVACRAVVPPLAQWSAEGRGQEALYAAPNGSAGQAPNFDWTADEEGSSSSILLVGDEDVDEDDDDDVDEDEDALRFRSPNTIFYRIAPGSVPDMSLDAPGAAPAQGGAAARRKPRLSVLGSPDGTPPQTPPHAARKAQWTGPAARLQEGGGGISVWSAPDAREGAARGGARAMAGVLVELIEARCLPCDPATSQCAPAPCPRACCLCVPRRAGGAARN